MKAFDPNYKLLDEIYQDDYYPAFLVDKVKDELQTVARDCIGVTVAYILEWFNIPIDTEEAIRKRDW